MYCSALFFPSLAVANIKPNLMLIITASFGFMRGPREGMFAGFASGLLIDIQYGNMIGFYALIYLLMGFASGIFKQMFFDEDIKLPILLIAVSDLIYGIVIYFLMFLLRSDFDFLYYLNRIIGSGGNLYCRGHSCSVPAAFIHQSQTGSRREKECK